MFSLNRIQVIGNLGEDPSSNKTKSDINVSNFSVATSHGVKNKEGEYDNITTWHKVVAWDKKADKVQKMLKKGSKVYVDGRIESRSWEDDKGIKRYSYEIVAQNIVILEKSEDSSSFKYDPNPNATTTPATDPSEELPF